MDNDISKCKELVISLEDSRNEMEFILNNIPLITILLDKEGKIRQFNKAAEEFSQESNKRIIGLRPGNVFHCIHSLDVANGCGFSQACKQCKINSILQDTLKDKKGVKDIEVPFCYYKEKEETDSILKITSSYLKIDNKDMVLLIMEDISYKKNIIQEQSIKQRLVGVLETAGAACHELNQPLQVLSANIEFLEANLDKPEKREKLFSRINDSIDKLGTITKKLSQITKYKTKKYIKDKHILDIESSALSN